MPVASWFRSTQTMAPATTGEPNAGQPPQAPAVGPPGEQHNEGADREERQARVTKVEAGPRARPPQPATDRVTRLLDDLLAHEDESEHDRYEQVLAQQLDVDLEEDCGAPDDDGS